MKNNGISKDELALLGYLRSRKSMWGDMEWNQLERFFDRTNPDVSDDFDFESSVNGLISRGFLRSTKKTFVGITEDGDMELYGTEPKFGVKDILQVDYPGEEPYLARVVSVDRSLSNPTEWYYTVQPVSGNYPGGHYMSEGCLSWPDNPEID